MSPQQSTSNQKSWALLVGIDDYADPSFPDLRFCVNDVLHLEDLLDKAGYTVICMHSQRSPVRDHLFPQHGYIEAQFKKLENLFGPNDLLLVYFACHGTRRGNSPPVLITTDTRAETLSKTGIAVADVETWMRKSSAGQLVIMLDACHIGQGTDEREITVSSEFADAVCKSMPEGFVLIASSTASQTSREFGHLEHGLFSYHVISGLSGAAKAKKHEQVTIGSLKEHILHEFRRETLKTGIPQRPQIRVSGDLDIETMVLIEETALSLLAEAQATTETKPVPAGTTAIAQQRQGTPPQRSESEITNSAQIPINWNNSQNRKLLKAALMQAYPSVPELTMFVDEEINENLAVITAPGDLERTAFELVKWARKEERIDELYQKFCNCHDGKRFITNLKQQLLE